MRPDFIQGLFLEIVWAIGIFLASVLIAWLILVGVHYIDRRLEKQARRPVLFPQLMESLTRPIFLLIIFEGLLLALGSLPIEQWGDVLGKARIVLLLILLAYALAKVVGVLLSWYLTTTRVRRKARVDEGLVRFIKRIMAIIIYAIGILIILDYLTISITPIIAGLGVGGLAVALALQPTLANFFAGTQIVSDRVVRVGDYIELDDGSSIRGFVTDIGWRSTRIRTPFNNLIIIPNSRLAESVITNYYGPTMEMGITINCGVSYNANLPRVEAVAMDVAKQVIEELDEADKSFEPWVIFEEFGDSNINFMIWVRAKDRLGSFRLKSEIIKRLKAALDKEGIMINYPARLLTFDPETMPPAFKESIQNQVKKEKKG